MQARRDPQHVGLRHLRDPGGDHAGCMADEVAELVGWSRERLAWRPVRRFAGEFVRHLGIEITEVTGDASWPSGRPRPSTTSPTASCTAACTARCSRRWRASARPPGWGTARGRQQQHRLLPAVREGSLTSTATPIHRRKPAGLGGRDPRCAGEGRSPAGRSGCRLCTRGTDRPGHSSEPESSWSPSMTTTLKARRAGRRRWSRRPRHLDLPRRAVLRVALDAVDGAAAVAVERRLLSAWVGLLPGCTGGWPAPLSPRYPLPRSHAGGGRDSDPKDRSCPPTTLSAYGSSRSSSFVGGEFHVCRGSSLKRR